MAEKSGVQAFGKTSDELNGESSIQYRHGSVTDKAEVRQLRCRLNFEDISQFLGKSRS